MRNGGGSVVYWPNRAETLRELSGRDSTTRECGRRPALPYAPRILIIDEVPNVRDQFLRILAEDGYYVQAVATARHARVVLRDHGAEVVTLNLSLPDVDGLELIRELRAEFPYIRILAVSGFMTDAVRAIATAAGATATLAKPTTPRKLRETVYRLLDSSCSWIGAG
jgi:CheY-like chemotaxis protein